jgi:hypothetical protein
VCQECRDEEDELMDPIEVGLRMPFKIMETVTKLGLEGEGLIKFGIMMDIAFGAVAVSAVERGLDRPVADYRLALTNKLKRLGPVGL